jgi:fumarate reductase flavoprotein subunit
MSSGVSSVVGYAIDLPGEQLVEIMERASGGHARPELVRAFAANAGRALAWLREEGVRFVKMYPTSKDRASWVMAPPRRFKAGLDMEGRGADISLRLLEKKLGERGGRLERGRRVISLIMEDGACAGVMAEADGRQVAYPARSVVIADGGFMASPEMIGRYISPAPDKLNIRSALNVRGEGMLMAQAAGAELAGLGEFYGHLQHRDAMTNENLWPYPTLDAVAQAGMVVGPDGRRFTDEGRGGVPVTNAIARLDDPLSATLIVDQAIWNGEPGRAGPVAAKGFLEEAGGWRHSADDLATLAGLAGLPAGGLAETVAAYNRAVGEGSLDRLDVPRTSTTFTPYPIARPPFHAIPLCAGITGTMGGLSIDQNARVLKPDGSPIEGLYAVGTTTGGLEGGPNVTYMGGLAKAFIWGLLAAEHAARRINSQLLEAGP